MTKFLAGVLVTVAFYNQHTILRYIHEWTAPHAVYQPKYCGPPPPLKNKSEVVEPSLEQLSALGFQTRNDATH